MTDVAAFDPAVANLVAARSRPAVLKHDFMSLRSVLPDELIFVFEGPEDKAVYFSWTQRTRSDLSYEPFVCRGKERVLALRDALLRDENGLARRVYFFVDRDFDCGESGIVAGDLFVTDRYAVENYLVSREVLEEILKIELHTEGHPAIRTGVLEAFDALYAQFLDELRPINARLFTARRTSIPLRKQLPDRLSKYVTLTLDSVVCTASAESVVELEREPTKEEHEAAEAAFIELHAPHRFRGKFALAFFERWLDLLVEDRCSKSSSLFPDLPRNVRINRQGMSMMTLAARSPLPMKFAEFIGTIAA